MKRKKAIKQKKKAIQEIDRQIIDNLGDILKNAAKKPNKEKPFETLGEFLRLVRTAKSLFFQRKLIQAEPIPPSKKCMIVGEGKEVIIKNNGIKMVVPLGTKVIRDEDTERILAAFNKTKAVTNEELSKKLDKINEAVKNKQL